MRLIKIYLTGWRINNFSCKLAERFRYQLSLTLSNQILVPLPESEARRAMFEELLPSIRGDLEIPYDVLVERTEGYSGSDIRLVCKEAAMQPLRRLMTVLEDKQDAVPENGKCIFFVDFVS